MRKSQIAALTVAIAISAGSFSMLPVGGALLRASFMPGLLSGRLAVVFVFGACVRGLSWLGVGI